MIPGIISFEDKVSYLRLMGTGGLIEAYHCVAALPRSVARDIELMAISLAIVSIELI